MGDRITNAVLKERIDNRHEAVIDKMDVMQQSMDKIVTQVELNTNFRLKCKGAIAVIASISAIIGGFVATKIIPFFNNILGKG